MVVQRLRVVLLGVILVLVFACAEEESSQEDPPLPPIYKVVFKAPIHTCMIKRMHGAREFVEAYAPSYSMVDVRPYSQPPNLVFYREGGATDVHHVRDYTAKEIVDFLASHGIYPDDAGAPEVKVSPPCKDEL